MVGDVAVGGDARLGVHSMTTTKTPDVDGTLAQIYALAGAGADIVRCTCNEEAAAEGLAQIVPRSPVPIIADIHFQYRLALAAMEAGVQGLRLNPGNIRKAAHIKAVAQEAKDRGLPIRIGVNAGSLDPDIAERYGITPEALVASAQRELAHFAEVDFDDVKISVMGCVVNGPGEAREADLGIAAGRGRGHLFVKGQVVRVVPEAEMVDALVATAKQIMDEGIDAVIASADAGAAAEAEATRVELI